MAWLTLLLFILVGAKLGLLAKAAYWPFVGLGCFIVDIAQRWPDD